MVVGDPTHVVGSGMSSALDDKYKLANELGHGSTGTVRAGRQRFEFGAGVSRERACAVKVMHPSQSDNPQARQAFADEAWRGYELCVHPNLVPTRELGATPGGSMYLVMDRAEDTLAELVDDALCAPLVRAVASAVLSALGHLHDAGLAHGDVHLGNVFVYANGAVKLGDLSNAGLLGSHPRCDTRADFQRLGLLLLRLITGELPFVELSVLRPVPDDTPSDLSELLSRLLAEPSESQSGAQPTASALPTAYELRALLDHRPGAIADAEDVAAWMRGDGQPVEPNDAGVAAAVEDDLAGGASNRAGWYAAGALALVLTALAGVWVGHALSQDGRIRAGENRSQVFDAHDSMTAPTMSETMASAARPESAGAERSAPEERGGQVVGQPVPVRTGTTRIGDEAVEEGRDSAREVEAGRRSDGREKDGSQFLIGADRLKFAGKGSNSDGITATVDRGQRLESGDVRLRLFAHNGGSGEYRPALARLIDSALRPVASVRFEHFLPHVESTDPFVGRVPPDEMAQVVLRLSGVTARAGETITLWISEANGHNPVTVNLVWP